MIAFRQPLYATLALAMALIIAYAHRANIARLMKGTEPRVGAKN